MGSYKRFTQDIMSDLRRLYDALEEIYGYEDSIEEALELLEDCNETVHCKDCKNRYTENCPVRHSKEYTDDDWYCADGEKW